MPGEAEGPSRYADVGEAEEDDQGLQPRAFRCQAARHQCAVLQFVSEGRRYDLSTGRWDTGVVGASQ